MPDHIESEPDAPAAGSVSRMPEVGDAPGFAADGYADIADAIEGSAPPLASELPAEDDGRLERSSVGDDADGADADSTTGTNAPRSMGFDVDELNSQFALVLMGGKAVIVRELAVASIDERVGILSIEAFQQWFRNRLTEVAAADGKIKTISWANAWMAHRRRRQFVGVEFFPNPDGATGTPGYLNFWSGFGVQPSPQGTYGVFRDHLLNNICGSDKALFDYVFAWCAHMVQRPRERIGTAIVLCGKMGTGKSKFGEVIGSLFPAHYFQVDDARYITGQFNVHMSKCILLQADEAVWAGDKAAEGRLKGLITSEHQMIESKGIDPFKLRNYVRIIMTSNEEWVVPAGKDERRYCVLDVDPRCAQNAGYFAEMDEELNNGGRERLLHDLLAFDLATVDLRHIPKTRALLEQKLRTLDPIESWLYNRLWCGTLTNEASDWAESVTASIWYDDYVRSAAQMGVGRKRSAAEFGKKLAKLLPDIRRVRLTEADEHGVSRRVWSYELPPLVDCRRAFAHVLNQVVDDWPAAPGEGERESAHPTDDNSLDDEIPV